MNRAKTFFTEAELQNIAETTRAVECCTIGEIAVMVVDSSEDYRDATLIGSLLLSSSVALLASNFWLDAKLRIAWFDASVWFFIAVSLLLFFPVGAIFRRVPGLKRPFIGIKRRETAVRQRAVRAFYEKGLYKTKANTGVLFFISLLEHKVWVLADKGIYDKIDQQTLNTYALTVSSGIREGHACDALCQAIRDAGEILAKHFPIAPGDTNELPDHVITE